MLTLVPNQFAAKAAAALGMPRAFIISRVCYRAAKAGMITGVLLAIARISGETAPLLFTALNNQFFSTNMNAPMASLPVVIFQFAPLAIQRMAAAGLDRRAHHHRHRARAVDRRARAVREEVVMNVATAATTTVATPTATHAPIDVAGLAEKVSIRNLNFYYDGESKALKDINLSLYQGKVFGVIGPSGCGKSTLLRVLNRDVRSLSEPARRWPGSVRRRRHPVAEAGSQSAACAHRMVFQKPTPFPMSIYENIAFGIRLYEKALEIGARQPRRDVAAARAALWDEAKDKLNATGSACRGGQQQRLCIARHRRG